MQCSTELSEVQLMSLFTVSVHLKVCNSNLVTAGSLFWSQCNLDSTWVVLPSFGLQHSCACCSRWKERPNTLCIGFFFFFFSSHLEVLLFLGIEGGFLVFIWCTLTGWAPRVNLVWYWGKKSLNLLNLFEWFQLIHLRAETVWDHVLDYLKQLFGWHTVAW